MNDSHGRRRVVIRDVATVHDLYGTSMQSITSAPASGPPLASAPATSTPQKQ